MTDPRRPDYPLLDDDVEGHDSSSGRIQPPRDESGDVHGHAHGARPETKDDSTDGDDVEGHVYVRNQDHSPQS